MKLGPYLKQAIESANWKKVCNVYHALTGELISPPKTVVADIEIEDDEEEEETSIVNMEIEDDEEEDDVENPPQRTTTSSPKNRDSYIAQSQPNGVRRKKKTGLGVEAKREAINTKNRKIKFKDDLTIAAKDLPSNNPQLAKLYVPPRPRGNRDAEKDTSAKIKVICFKCGQAELVSPLFASSYDEDDEKNTYRCNACCKGGRE